MSLADKILVLADESANWEIAGLRQLDRLALAVNEFRAMTEPGEKIDIVVFWKPDVAPAGRWLPDSSRLSHARVIESTTGPAGFEARVLSTRLFLERRALAAFLEIMPERIADHSAVDPAQAWQQLFEQFERACRDGGENGWRFLGSSNEIAGSERRFLRGAGKSQDGFVSRFLNRPISRQITRLLLKYPITPTTWTLSIFILPLISFAFLVRGGYIDILIGTLVYQLYSIFDGCDGEIARAKYLESKAGGRIDDFCDLVGGLFFVIGLGLGLHRSSAVGSAAWLYAPEGILCAGLIVANEFLLRTGKSGTTLKSRLLGDAMYPRHRQLIEHSGLAVLGENFAWWLVQITKRDVGILFFVLLAFLGRPQWILHLWLAVTVVDVVLAGIARMKRHGTHH